MSLLIFTQKEKMKISSLIALFVLPAIATAVCTPQGQRCSRNLPPCCDYTFCSIKTYHCEPKDTP